MRIDEVEAFRLAMAEGQTARSSVAHVGQEQPIVNGRCTEDYFLTQTVFVTPPGRLTALQSNSPVGADACQWTVPPPTTS